MQQLEQSIQKSILDFLGWVQIVAAKTDASRAFNDRGEPRHSKVTKDWPDITMVLPDGRAAFFEVKSKTGRLSEGQKVMLQKLHATGAYVAVVRSLDDAISCLDYWLKEDSPQALRLKKIHERLKTVLNKPKATEHIWTESGQHFGLQIFK
jgi:hypothetical protein